MLKLYNQNLFSYQEDQRCKRLRNISRFQLLKAMRDYREDAILCETTKRSFQMDIIFPAKSRSPERTTRWKGERRL